MTITVNEALVNALEDLRTNGWTKHDFGRNHGSKCAAGALRMAIAGTTSTCFQMNSPELRIYDEAKRVISNVMGFDNIFFWNDSACRTFSEVEFAFEHAIKNTKGDTE